MPTEATIAQVLVSKYADHLPLYRQAQIYARQGGIDLDRSTLADWVGHLVEDMIRTGRKSMNAEFEVTLVYDVTPPLNQCCWRMRLCTKCGVLAP